MSIHEDDVFDANDPVIEKPEIVADSTSVKLERRRKIEQLMEDKRLKEELSDFSTY